MNNLLHIHSVFNLGYEIVLSIQNNAKFFRTSVYMSPWTNLLREICNQLLVILNKDFYAVSVGDKYVFQFGFMNIIKSQYKMY